MGLKKAINFLLLTIAIIFIFLIYTSCINNNNDEQGENIDSNMTPDNGSDDDDDNNDDNDDDDDYDTTDYINGNQSMTISPLDEIHVVYAVETHYFGDSGDWHKQRLNHALKNTGTWDIQNLDLLDDYVWENSFLRNSMISDQSGDIYIAYEDHEFLSMKHYNNGNWVTSEKIIEGGFSNSIALDSSGLFQVSHMKMLTDYSYDLYCSEFDTVHWQHENLLNLKENTITKIVMDSAGSVIVMYGDKDGYRKESQTHDLKKLMKTGGLWGGPEIVIEDIIKNCFSMGVDSLDNLHILYSDDSGLGYATNESGSWDTTIIDSGGGYAQPKLAISNDNKINVAYFRNNYAAIYYLEFYPAFTEPLMPEIVDSHTNWQTQTLKRYNVHIAQDSLGNSHIVFTDCINQAYSSFLTDCDLKYATNSPGSWISEVIISVP